MAARLTAYVVVGIVAATLIAGLIVGAQRDDTDGPVDVIVHNAKVYTAGPAGTMAEAVAIRGNQILRVGSEREIMRLRRPQTTMIDAKGAAVVPGFNDAHLDFIGGGLGLDRDRPVGAETLDEIQARIRTWASRTRRRAVGARARLGREPFRRRPADAAAARRDRSRSAGADLSATTAIRRGSTPGRCRLAQDHREDAGSGSAASIVKDPRTGEPTGVLKEAAMALVDCHVPQPTRAERARALRAAIGEAQRNGITSVQDASGTADDFELYAEARRDGDLGVRVYSRRVGVGDADRRRRSPSSTGRASSIPTTRSSRPAPSASCWTASSKRTRRRCSSRTPTTASGAGDAATIRRRRAQPHGAAARRRRLAGHDARRRRPRREHGARRPTSTPSGPTRSRRGAGGTGSSTSRRSMPPTSRASARSA